MEEVTHITVARCGMTYAIPTPLWRAAVVTFEQHYRKGVDVRGLARGIAADLIADDRHDPFGRERLARCLLSEMGKRKPGRPPSPPSGQGTLFPIR